MVSVNARLCLWVLVVISAAITHAQFINRPRPPPLFSFINIRPPPPPSPPSPPFVQSPPPRSPSPPPPRPPPPKAPPTPALPKPLPPPPQQPPAKQPPLPRPRLPPSVQSPAAPPRNPPTARSPPPSPPTVIVDPNGPSYYEDYFPPPPSFPYSSPVHQKFPPAPPAGSGLFIPSNLAEIKVDAGQRKTMGTSMWGTFFAEMDHSGEGGLYAELVRDRSFDAMDARAQKKFSMATSLGKSWLSMPETDWSLLRVLPLNTNNKVFLRVSVAKKVTGGMVNQGFNGIAVKAGAQYYASLWARCVQGTCASLTVTLYSGTSSYGSITFTGIPTAWTKFAGMITSSGTDIAAVLSVSFDGPAKVDIDVVSLFPGESYVLGLPYLTPFRNDLLQQIKALKPRFLQFPGGMFITGNSVSSFMWKTALGPIENRPGHWISRKYWSTDGLGLFEYMLLCDAVGAAPVMVVNSGDTAESGRGLSAWVQDAVDAVEFVMGAPSTTYGKIRASMGRQAPWVLPYIVVGSNSVCGSSANTPYKANFPAFYTALRNRWPTVGVMTSCKGVKSGFQLSTMAISSPQPDMFWDNRYLFDDPLLRTYPPMYVNDFSVTSGDGDLSSALAEAALMMGMERNPDVVAMGSFSQLMSSVFDRSRPNAAIKFDNTRLCGSPSYYVQQLFSQYQGVTALRTMVDVDDVTAPLFVYASSTCQDAGCRQILVKAINFDMMPHQTSVMFSNLGGSLQPTAQLMTFTSDNSYDTNSLDLPNVVTPTYSQVAVAATTRLLLPAYSLTFLTVSVQ